MDKIAELTVETNAIGLTYIINDGSSHDVQNCILAFWVTAVYL